MKQFSRSFRDGNPGAFRAFRNHAGLKRPVKARSARRTRKTGVGGIVERKCGLSPHGNDGDVQPVTNGRNRLTVKQIAQAAVAVAAKHHQVDLFLPADLDDLG